MNKIYNPHRNKNSKLDEAQVRAILIERARENTPYSKLSRKFGVSIQTIANIVTRVSWQDIAVPEVGIEAIGVSSK